MHDEDAEFPMGHGPSAIAGTRRAPARRHLPRWAVIGVATLTGAFAAVASSGSVSASRPSEARAAAAPAPRKPSPPPPPAWPRALPRDPEQWLRQVAGGCSLSVTGLKTEANATSFPLPSGKSVALWEVSLRLGAEGTPAAVRALVDQLGAAACGVNVPELDMVWLPDNRVKLDMHAVLLGTWADRAAPGRAPRS